MPTSSAKKSTDRIASLVHIRAEQDESSPQSAVRDTITDLRHFCDSEKIDFTEVLNGSLEVWTQEKIEPTRIIKCFACGIGMPGITVHDFKHSESHDEIDWQFCPNHAIMWALRRLEPETIRKMREAAGCDTHTTHDDFYDGDGNSVQPVGA